MTETRVHELLDDVASQVAPADLLPGVLRGVRRRRQRRAAAAVVAVGLTTGAVMYGVVHIASGATSQPLKQPIASHSPSPTRRATSSVTPAFLPAGATLIRSGPVESPPGAHSGSPQHPTVASSYHLAGASNANTMPLRPLTAAEAKDPAYHPATTLEITFAPREQFQGQFAGPPLAVLRRLLPPAEQRFGFSRKAVTIFGNQALITLDQRLGGAFRIDWIDPAGYHSVECDRNLTAGGLSGLDGDVLLHIARSLYTDG